MAKKKGGDDEQQPIIIIRRKKHGDHEGHGGGWKVAYADFVTAMMAFFLLLWLLNVTTKQQQEGIAEYFNPLSVSKNSSGSDGMLSGKTITSDGASKSTAAEKMVAVPFSGQQGDTEGKHDKQGNNDGRLMTPEERRAAEKAQREAVEREEKKFGEIEEQIKQQIEAVPDLKDLAENLLIEKTPDGLRIQIVDRDKNPMFPSGSAEPYDKAKRLLQVIGKAIKPLPNKLSVTGHTDGSPMAPSGRYTNWELSADRANAARRVLYGEGNGDDRFQRVEGKADREHLFAEDPRDPRNRRISVTVLRTVPLPAVKPQQTSDSITGNGRLPSSEPPRSAPNAPGINFGFTGRN